ncbi:MAG: hypothetical protein ACFFDF_14920 [Candidatus Odinarchaeota archaeon]
MDYYRFESFDITPVVEEHQGKRLEDLYQNYCIVKNRMGEFIEFFWEQEDIPIDIDLFKTQTKLPFFRKSSMLDLEK